MLEIINDKFYHYNANNSYYNEDIYFSYYPNIYSPRRDIAKTFAVETYYYDKPVGIHKAFNFVNQEQYNELMTHIPKMQELDIKYNNLRNQTLFGFPNPDRSYKTNFFENCKIINFN